MFHPRGPSFFELVYQALCSTERGYDLLAPKFDFTPFRTPDLVLAAAARVASEREVFRSLDLCCGTGAFFEVQGPSQGSLSVGLDFSMGMLTEAKKHSALSSSFVRADALASWPFGEPFQLVTCFGAIGHIAVVAQEAFFRRIYDAVATGGRFLCVTAPAPSKKEAAYWLAKAFNASIWIRNRCWPREFIMYYMTFDLDRAELLLGEIGFSLDIRYPFSEPYERLALVVAEK